MWLRYDESRPPVRLGRFLDDVVNKHTAYVYPDVVVPSSGPGAAEETVRVQPCYTAQNEFSVRVTAL